MARSVTMTNQRITILRFLIKYHADHRFSPSYHEIADGVDSMRMTWDRRRTSTSSVRYHLESLSEYGYIYYEAGVSRGFAPTEKGIQYIEELDHEAR